AHLMRELNGFIELYNDKWTVQMKALLQKAIKLKQSMSPEQYSKSNQARDKILDDFEKLIEIPIPENIPKLPAFKNRLKKHRNSVFTFLFYPDVPFDNNGSERGIRNIKVKQKVSGAFRSERGAEIFAVIRSVIDTMIKRDADVFEHLKFMINLAIQKKAFITSL
ncbi:MAG: transposase, partial [Prolixibacteraceae bacterium]|nr:transposase [Prolixibacteraceae bacterium]